MSGKQYTVVKAPSFGEKRQLTEYQKSYNYLDITKKKLRSFPGKLIEEIVNEIPSDAEGTNETELISQQRDNEIKSKIAAITHVLESFENFELNTEEERIDYLSLNCESNTYIKTYIGYSEMELRKALEQVEKIRSVYADQLTTGAINSLTGVERSGLFSCISRMTEIKVEVSGEEYTILKCDDNFKLSKRVTPEFPDFVLIRQCTLDIISLIQTNVSFTKKFLITGTPGIGKTVSIIVWLYLVFQRKLRKQFEHIIVDLNAGCVLLSHSVDSSMWIEKWYHREFFIVRKTFESVDDVLYLNDASLSTFPLFLPYCTVIFSPPNQHLFSDFIEIESPQLQAYCMPAWKWNEIESFYRVSTDIQGIEMRDIRRLHDIWGGLPKQIFVSYDEGYQTLISSIRNCNPVSCLQILEKGEFFTYDMIGAMQMRSKLMQFEVEDDGSYQHSIVNFGSPFIRDEIVAATAKTFSGYYREFISAHGHNEFSAKIRGSLYERIVNDKLRSICTEMNVMSFVMERGFANTDIKMITISVNQISEQNVSALPDLNHSGLFDIPTDRKFLIFYSYRPLWTLTTVAKAHLLNAQRAYEFTQLHKNAPFIRDVMITFCMPPDVFDWWHKNNSTQNFVGTSGNLFPSSSYENMNPKKQLVICIPGDLIEEEIANSMMTNDERKMIRIHT